jgi:hypothetical protein
MKRGKQGQEPRATQFWDLQSSTESDGNLSGVPQVLTPSNLRTILIIPIVQEKMYVYLD